MKDFVLAASSVFRGEIINEKRGYHHKEEYDEAMVCITCESKKCTGDDRCFNRRKQQLIEEGKLKCKA